MEGCNGAVGVSEGAELRREGGSPVGDHDDRRHVHDDHGEHHSQHSGSKGGSVDSGGEGSDSEASNHGSYESYSSDSRSDSGSGSSSHGASYDSSSGESDSSSSSHASRASLHSKSSRSSDRSGRERRSPVHAPSAAPSNYSPNRTFHRGVLPILTHGQNCNPNRSTLVHRRGRAKEGSDGAGANDTQQRQDLPQSRPDDARERDSDGRESSRHRHRRDRGSRHRRKRSKRSKPTNYVAKYLCLQTEKRSTQLLVVGFALWILAQCYYFSSVSLRDIFPESAEELRRVFFGMAASQRGRGPSGKERRTVHHEEFNHRDMYVQRTPKEMEELRAQRTKEARAALGTGAGEFDDTAYLRDSGGKGKPGKPNDRRRSREGRKKNRDAEGNTPSERLKEGCSALEWQAYHFPNCNEIHEIDMRTVVRHGRRKKKDDDSTATPWGFVGNGLWRDVFACDPHGEAARDENATSHPLPPAVLKVMKSEHPYDVRNFQRHRRDALVMERLSSSHHLVPIYGYCANTVLTQAISHTLDDVIYARENEKVKKWSPHGGYKTKPPLESWMGKGDDGELLATRETAIGRIRLALGVFRGLMDLHEGDGKSGEWLPVVHADLQSRQYLVDAATGQIYLNDFNRCRFLAKKDRPTNSTGKGGKAAGKETLESCPIQIPTAPGASRSPEEYDMVPLTEKLDVYSAGNILYGIITGNRPWNGDRGKHIKAAIQKGERPEVGADVRGAEGTVDAELTRLLDRVYEGDPEKRASAKEIVEELERLLEGALAGKVSPTRRDERPPLVEQKERKAKKDVKGKSDESIS